MDYAKLSNVITEPLDAFTISFWIKTTDKDNQGTPFSYAVDNEDNALTITDLTSST